MLKKPFSYLLIILLMLNVMGYYGFFVGLQYQNERKLAQRLDAADYDVKQTVTFTIPLSLPYATDDADFTRATGQFEHDGEFLQIVNRKYAHDTLTVVCVKDVEQKRIHLALADFVKTFSDKSAGEPVSVKTLPVFSKDYISNKTILFSQAAGWAHDVHVNSSTQVMIASYTVSIVHPPERG